MLHSTCSFFFSFLLQIIISIFDRDTEILSSLYDTFYTPIPISRQENTNKLKKPKPSVWNHNVHWCWLLDSLLKNSKTLTDNYFPRSQKSKDCAVKKMQRGIPPRVCYYHSEDRFSSGLQVDKFEEEKT